MKYYQAIAKHYGITAEESLVCPKCKADLTKEGAVNRLTNTGDNVYQWGHYDGKMGDFEPEKGESGPRNGWGQKGFTDNCGECEEQLGGGDDHHYYPG